MQPIDYRAELAQYDWHNARWGADKLIAASPFRDDRRPSFYVWLDGEAAGTWGDSGTGDKGGFTRLLAQLRGEPIEQASAYLTDKYGGDPQYEYDAPLTLNLRLPDAPSTPWLPASLLDQYERDYMYLRERGVSESVQHAAGVRYDRVNQALVLPWLDGNGRLCAVFYRSARGKAFWYAEGGRPIRECLFGIDRVYQQRAPTVVLCEAPIDALSADEMATTNAVGVATGSASISDVQAQLIAKSPAQRVVLAGDNDEAGRRFNTRCRRLLGGFGLEFAEFKFGANAKDINDQLRYTSRQ